MMCTVALCAGKCDTADAFFIFSHSLANKLLLKISFVYNNHKGVIFTCVRQVSSKLSCTDDWKLKRLVLCAQVALFFLSESSFL